MNGFGVATGAIFTLLALASCSKNDAENDGNVVVADDAFNPMKAGLWETKFVFNEVNVPSLGKAQKQQIMEEVAKSTSGRSCLSATEAKKPGADFFGGAGTEKCVYKAFDVAGQNVKMKLACGMDGMGSIDVDLAGAMGKTNFSYDSVVAVRLPMIGKVTMTGNAIGKYVGECPAA